MASREKPKVYRLRGIPSRLQTKEEVSCYLSDRFPELNDHDIQICSLAKGSRDETLPAPWVATVMFHPPNPSNDAANRSLRVNPAEAISKANDGLAIDEDFLGMTPLNDVRPDDYKYDCVAVSGIGSHPFGSWIAHDSDKQFMWIRDALPKFFPYTKAMTYGYDTELRGTYSFQNIQDFAGKFIYLLKEVFESSAARRSIILIAHSLGGIIVKQALVMLAKSANDTELLLHPFLPRVKVNYKNVF